MFIVSLILAGMGVLGSYIFVAVVAFVSWPGQHGPYSYTISGEGD
jgi:hypothetical protein